MARTLRRVQARLEGSACSAYLLADGGRTLAAAMTVDAPLSFSIPSSFATEDLSWPSVRAFRSGRAVVFTESDLRQSVDVLPRSPVTLAVPDLLPLSIAACPVLTASRVYGVITAHWSPPRPITPADVEFLQREADGLAATFESQGDVDLRAPAVPEFITGDYDGQQSEELSESGRRLLGECMADAAERGGFLHQLHRLSTELVMAMRVQDILAVARDRVVRPYGGTGFAVCFAEGDHLHVAGAADLSHDVLDDLEGTPLTGTEPVAEAMRRGRARIVPFVAARARSADPLSSDEPTSIDELAARAEPEAAERSIGFFPILQSGTAVGCCVIDFTEADRPTSAPKTTLLTLMLDQVGQAYARARSVAAERDLGRSMQRSLLPRSFPHIPEMVVTARYAPATSGDEAGRAWYDVIALPAGRIGLVIGDVEGPTQEATVVMGQLRIAVRAYAAEGHEPAAILERTNHLLLDLDSGLHATCCCMVFDTATGRTTSAGAGHAGPLVRYSSMPVSQPQVAAEAPLGRSATTVYRQSTFQLQPGAVVALFTEGLRGLRHSADGSRVNRLVRTLGAQAAADLEIVADRMIDGGGDGQAFDDDAALILMRYEGGGRRESGEVARMFVEGDDLRGVGEVRAFLRDLLERWNRTGTLDEMQVMASEVVTNALIHAHSRVDLRLRRYPNRIRVEVQDSDPNPPVPTTLLEDDAGNEVAEHGRGLLIVEALARAWGSSPAGRGKITWFEI